MKPLQAPEIFQKPIASVDTAGLPPRGSPGFGEALIARIAMDYAGRGWSAVVTVDDEFVRVVAVPEHGMGPKTYVLGLLRERYLEDALPLLEALHGMLDDADIAYNYGICLSELGRVEEALAPLERCIAIDATYTNANAQLHAPVDGAARMDAVFYMQGAMDIFARKSQQEVGRIVMEIAQRGQSGLQINKPEVRYTLESLPGEFSGLHLLCLMHVGIRLLDATVDTGTGLDREYDLALAMRGDAVKAGGAPGQVSR